jgi:hypothetical protein
MTTLSEALWYYSCHQHSNQSLTDGVQNPLFCIWHACAVILPLSSGFPFRVREMTVSLHSCVPFPLAFHSCHHHVPYHTHTHTHLSTHHLQEPFLATLVHSKTAYRLPELPVCPLIVGDPRDLMLVWLLFLSASSQKGPSCRLWWSLCLEWFHKYTGGSPGGWCSAVALERTILMAQFYFHWENRP